MTAIILAAGYATRLYPLTKDRPKPLLDVGGRTIIDRLVDGLAGVPAIDRCVVVTNARFFQHFLRWRSERLERIDIINDGTSSNESRLGALRDLALAVKESGVEGPALVVAGDNIFDFAFAGLVRFFDQVKVDCITVHRLTDREALSRTGVVQMDPDDRVTGFAEKPTQPASTWAAPPLYVYTGETLNGRLPEFLAGSDADAPGAFVPWLLERAPVAAYRIPGERYDIGNHESYAAACERFGNQYKEQS